jgi:hypothetical protein
MGKIMDPDLLKMCWCGWAGGSSTDPALDAVIIQTKRVPSAVLKSALACLPEI